MNNNKELEFSFVEGDIEAIEKSYPNKFILNLYDFYFDTKTGILENKGFVFRRRIIDEKSIYTIKGLTYRTSDNIPERFEYEDSSYHKTIDKLEELLCLRVYQELVTVQERKIERHVHPIKGFELCIDYVDYLTLEAKYVNIELELKDPQYKQNFLDFKDRLIKHYRCVEWDYSKNQVGKAIKRLGFIGNMQKWELSKIKEYLDKQ